MTRFSSALAHPSASRYRVRLDRGSRFVLAALVALAALVIASPTALAQEAGAREQQKELPSVEDKTDGMTHWAGFFDLFWDEDEGKLYLQVDRWGEEFLYQVSLPTGLGSNPVGLDRGQLGGTHVLKAERVGPKVLLVEPNYGFRALSEDPAERRAVAEAFAPSTHWGFKIVARTDDRVLVDATDFFLRDAHGVVRTLDRSGQGKFTRDSSRSAFYLPRTKSFPRNTEVEVSLTYKSDAPGPLVRQTAASGEAVTLRQHHSLVELPEDGYEPRRADPRVGAFGITFHDYASPIDQPVAVRWVSRHRLERADPTAERSRPIEPIVYYLDPGVPEPIRSALIEGASWWNQAFEAAGYIDAFQVEMLPDGADPMDLRYNVIHWTHRATRGWSYGSSVTDPRTGEILKGNVNLGSLRLRQDHLLAVGFGFEPGSSDSGALDEAPASAWSTAGPPAQPTGRRFGVCDLSAGPTFSYLAEVAANGNAAEMALARIRQLSAHEVGHTLGLSHNFIASTYERASVMDYPAPLVRITSDGELDVSQAYDVDIGEYDKFVIRWLYSDFATGVAEAGALDAIVEEGLASGIRFISDADARPPGAAHPLAHLWDNGADPIGALRDEIEVRRIGLGRFDAQLIPEGEALSSLQGILVPLYLHHRYQVEAAARSVGGADYSYAVRGDGQPGVAIVPGERQREALDAVLETLTPDFLALPDRVLDLIPPRAFFTADQELFASGTGPTFDPFGVAASAAELTVSLLLESSRTARLVEFHSRDATNPGLDEVLDGLLSATWRSELPSDAYLARVAETVRGVVLEQMLDRATGGRGAAPVRAILAANLDELASWLEARPSPTPHERLAASDIRRWQERPYDHAERAEPASLPPGSPIGRNGVRP
jgi:hypothetical protein